MVFGGWLDYEKTGSVDGPVLCMGFDGIAVSVRWVIMLYANVLHLFAMFLRYLNEIVCKTPINLTLMY